jgi:calcineurin-like phosphoesterase family protein
MGEVFNYHGHSHKHQFGHPYFNVGVDLHNYKPIEVELDLNEKDIIHE